MFSGDRLMVFKRTLLYRLRREVVVLGTDNGMLACKVLSVWGNGDVGAQLAFFINP